MEELLAIMIGAFAVALAPLVPGLRPVAKAAVKGGLVLAEAATGVAVVAGQQWDHMTAKAGSTQKAAGAPVVAEAAPAATAIEPDKARVTPAKRAVAKTRTTQAATEQETAGQTPPDQTTAMTNVEDLSRIDGIGPKTAELLVASGIATLEQLAATSVDALRELLSGAGPRYRAMDPTSWPEQALRLVASD